MSDPKTSTVYEAWSMGGQSTRLFEEKLNRINQEYLMLLYDTAKRNVERESYGKTPMKGFSFAYNATMTKTKRVFAMRKYMDWLQRIGGKSSQT
jgi:hypothetical protein